MKRVLFGGGGTGGHIYPALAIREALLERFPDLETAYAGQSEGMEARIVGRVEGLPFLPVRSQGMPRSLSAKWLTFPFRNAAGFFDALTCLRQFRPDLVITTGGYVAFPVLACARLLGIPFVIHEQNAAMGVVNRLFAGSARKVLLTYGEAVSELDERVILTGNPVRRAFRVSGGASGRFVKKPGEFWLLAVGGSGGARTLNDACVELTKGWLKEHPAVHLVHIAGERDHERVKAAAASLPNYELLPYLHEMKEAFDVADLLVSRAGATILAEIAVCGKPAILVPFPFATDNHQEKNARALERLGAATMILDRDLCASTLAREIEVLTPSGKRTHMAEAMRSSRPADVEQRIIDQIAPLLAASQPRS
ncbi:MAG TPA: undecaprenyldiphospho-muramoylpentapeptide beta-N-acetylglucosaminyltransferase [Candidatus Ozemobacteraceae bacterium]|nr:undecaprenyldiphospho-muramoylpentapeptide beta-N-acetylglucosaminyltransferase [Candidatus Ozemobacteraceae bacterium]